MASLTPDQLRWAAMCAVLAGYVVLGIVAVGAAVAHGHAAHARYLFPFLPVVVVGLTWGLDRLWSNRWFFLAVVALMFIVENRVITDLVAHHSLFILNLRPVPHRLLGQRLALAAAFAGALPMLLAIAAHEGATNTKPEPAGRELMTADQP
jgi:hypothetical protein